MIQYDYNFSINVFFLSINVGGKYNNSSTVLMYNCEVLVLISSATLYFKVMQREIYSRFLIITTMVAEWFALQPYS